MTNELEKMLNDFDDAEKAVQAMRQTAAAQSLPANDFGLAIAEMSLIQMEDQILNYTALEIGKRTETLN